jgi:hypothetical protein
MFNPLTTQVAELHQADVLSAAAKQRKALDLPTQQAGLWGRMLLQLGDLLIAAGLRLHERYEAQVCADPGPYQPVTW